jgi:DNA-binding GntR family transcriptional regulator
MTAMARPPSPALTVLGGPIRTDSVVDLAYERLRTMILDGDVPPGGRLSQAELAHEFGISRTPVREALRRLTGEGLVEFEPNHGFRAAGVKLDQVLQRLEVRLLLEPSIARLAAQRRDDGHLDGLDEAIAREEAATSRAAAHDASRDFHIRLAQATGNSELAAVSSSLWIVEIGRRLLARRSLASGWRGADVSEHRAVADAVRARDPDAAAELTERHVRAALRHWQQASRGAPVLPSG